MKNNVMMTEKELYTEKQTADALLENSYVSDIEGWWQAWKDGNRQYVRVRLDVEKQVYVVDAVGQETRHSEELWRYKQASGWIFLRA